MRCYTSNQGNGILILMNQRRQPAVLSCSP